MRDPKTGQFLKGTKPWNKGLKGSTGFHPNTKKHSLKKD